MNIQELYESALGRVKERADACDDQPELQLAYAGALRVADGDVKYYALATVCALGLAAYRLLEGYLWSESGDGESDGTEEGEGCEEGAPAGGE